jgi:3'-phosphoadenosine 5'-phosphosulfate sulfotransferase
MFVYCKDAKAVHVVVEKNLGMFGLQGLIPQ